MALRSVLTTRGALGRSARLYGARLPGRSDPRCTTEQAAAAVSDCAASGSAAPLSGSKPPEEQQKEPETRSMLARLAASSADAQSNAPHRLFEALHLQAFSHAELSESFARLDADRDGRLTAADVLGVLRHPQLQDPRSAPQRDALAAAGGSYAAARTDPAVQLIMKFADGKVRD